jgi:hypothetical protein
MTASSDDKLQELQSEVQRLLGRCLLRLQQYERLIKAIIAQQEISGPVHDLERMQAARIADSARKTLGNLVRDLLGSYIVANQIDSPLSAAADSFEDANSISIGTQIALSDADFVRTETGLRELVLLRNDLVHHFIDRYDLESLDGCHRGCDALVDAFSKIDHRLHELRTWADDMRKMHGLMAQIVQSDQFRDFVVTGISPDETIRLPDTGIVRALQEAAGELALDGWATVSEAGGWIAARQPEQVPEKYGYASWRQVVHEARIFELRYLERGGRRTACYREKGEVHQEQPVPSRLVSW